MLKEKKIVSIASTVVKIENIVFTYNNLNGDVIGLSSQPHDLVVGDVITVSGLINRFFKKIRW